MKISVGGDHAGFPLMATVIAVCKDLGQAATFSTDEDCRRRVAKLMALERSYNKAPRNNGRSTIVTLLSLRRALCVLQ